MYKNSNSKILVKTHVKYIQRANAYRMASVKMVRLLYA